MDRLALSGVVIGAAAVLLGLLARYHCLRDGVLRDLELEKMELRSIRNLLR